MDGIQNWPRNLWHRSEHEQILFVLRVIHANQRAIYKTLSDVAADQAFSLHMEENMALDLTSLTAAATNEATVEASAVALLQSISTQLSAAAGDPAAVQAIADQLNSQAQSLADAVVANTPAAPTA